MLDLVVASICVEAKHIKSFELRLSNGGSLPSFTAGAHIDLHLPNQMIRSYSLTNAESERHRYTIAVKDEVAGRGGSHLLHRDVKEGDVLRVGAPVNSFPLVEAASEYVLIAGGIGITPLWCMLQRLEALQRRWTLYYFARTKTETAFLDQLTALGCLESLHIVFTREPDAARPSLEEIIRKALPDAQFYCCGPSALLTEFERATQSLPPGQVHSERFGVDRPLVGNGFTVRLAKSGRDLFVPADKSILESVLAAGVNANYSCLVGTCGTCLTRVVSGSPDHRDSVLAPAVKKKNKSMLICCSGSLSDLLVLDL